MGRQQQDSFTDVRTAQVQDKCLLRHAAFGANHGVRRNCCGHQEEYNCHILMGHRSANLAGEYKLIEGIEKKKRPMVYAVLCRTGIYRNERTP